MGGTFDFIHIGHVKLLSEAFQISDKVIIGLTSDELATKKGKKLENPYEQRLENLIEIIEKNELNNYDVHVITSNWHMKRVNYIFQTCLPKTKIIFHGIETPCDDLEKEDKSLEKFK